MEENWNHDTAERHAHWARVAARWYYAPIARKIASCISSLGDEPVLVDLGTGPGILALQVHRILPHAKIIGVDPSREMLNIARINASESGMENFDARLGRAEEIPIETDSIDLVFSQFSFHEWQDQAKGLEEVFRILRPGGWFVLRDFNGGWFSGWKRNLVKLLCAAVGESYEDHLEMFQFSFDRVASFLEAAGFRDVQGQGKGLVMFIRAVKVNGAELKPELGQWKERN
jgi:ubiquinone/menaquinone biosynthesis C-methylase UbiE